MATIIIEGANFTGKSTLVEELKQHFPIYRGLSGLSKETVKRHELSDVLESDWYAVDFINQTGFDVVLERSVLTGCVYQDIPLQYLEEYYSSFRIKPTVILLTAPREELERRMCKPESAGRMLLRGITQEKVHELNSEYLRIAEDIHTLVNLRIFDTYESSPGEIAHFVRKGMVRINDTHRNNSF